MISDKQLTIEARYNSSVRSARLLSSIPSVRCNPVRIIRS
ncbi:Uncharacterised protein [Vibrio cholerae]|nr:Uncharacterised protein [Vibrio cholerae]